MINVCKIQNFYKNSYTQLYKFNKKRNKLNEQILKLIRNHLCCIRQDSRLSGPHTPRKVQNL